MKGVFSPFLRLWARMASKSPKSPKKGRENCFDKSSVGLLKNAEIYAWFKFFREAIQEFTPKVNAPNEYYKTSKIPLSLTFY